MVRLATAFVLVGITSVVPVNAQPAPSLRIVVIEGEGGVNIIQQKTAVAPLVEVRDRNNLPVNGASVTFRIAGGNNASFSGGARTLTVTTDTAGRARASGLNPLRSGKFQIQVQASYQGQVATAAISQTTVATAAAAAAIGAGAAAGGAAAGGAATGGAASGGAAAGGAATGGAAAGAAAGGAAGAGGMSAATIGIIGGAVAGGAFAAREVVGGKSGGSGSEFSSYSGTLSGQLLYTTVLSVPGRTSTCVWTEVVTGTMKMDFKNADHAVGNVFLEVVETAVSVTSTCILGGPATMFTLAIDATGGPGALAFTGTSQSGTSSTSPTHKVGFNGSLSGSAITGTLSIETTAPGTDGVSPSGSGSTSLSVTLRQVN